MDTPPYTAILQRLKSGKVIPFLGAAASFVDRPPGAAWNPQNVTFLPNGSELSRVLAQEAEFPSEDPKDRDDLAKVSSYYADIAVGRSPLRDRLRELLNHSYQSGPLHHFLAELETPLVMVVTNYDTLLEKAFREKGKPYELVVYPSENTEYANAVLWWRHGESKPKLIAPNKLDIDLSKKSVIYKMHGTLFPETNEWDNFVITEEDYVEFLSRMTTRAAIPAIFFEYFRQRSFLFLGYSLRDWNLRVILRNLSNYISKTNNSTNDRIHSWAIQRDPSKLEKRLWENRNVNIYDVQIDEFVKKLRAIMVKP